MWQDKGVDEEELETKIHTHTHTHTHTDTEQLKTLRELDALLSAQVSTSTHIIIRSVTSSCGLALMSRAPFIYLFLFLFCALDDG